MNDFTRVRYSGPVNGVASIVLARPDMRNAQDRALLYEVNAAFDLAGQDDEVRVVVLSAEGPHFSAGHDFADIPHMREMDDFQPVTCWGGFDAPGAEGWMAVEQEVYLGLCWRWRNFPKPTIAQVQGKAIAGGLMLVWVCDLVVAAENAEFSDPVAAWGMNGHEFFVHPWEVGPRKAKEMLFTGEAFSAREAHRLGMVNHVVPLDELSDFTQRLAEHIARRPSMGLKLAKQSVNQALDAQGQWTAVQSAFGLHQLGHSHNREVHGDLIHPDGAAIVSEQVRSGPAFVTEPPGPAGS